MKSPWPTWLAVPADEKEAAQQAHPPLNDGRPALVWNGEHKLWYARPGTELDRMAKWLPRPQDFSTGQSDPVSEFALTLEKAGLVLKGPPVMDGSIQRVPTRDDRQGGKSGAYRAFLDGRPAGWYRDYRSEHSGPTTWVFSGGEEADPRVRLHLRAQAQQNRDNSQRDREQQYNRQARYARRYLARCQPVSRHPYLIRKGITAVPGVRLNDRQELVIPLSNIRGDIRSYQRIPESGGKDARLLKEAEKTGNFFALGDYHRGEAVLFAEGYATAATLHEASGLPVLMTVDAANMVDVALNVRAALPETPLVFCADNDAHLPVNKGVSSAQQAAILTVGQFLIPEFTLEETTRGLTDFNDLALARGHEAFTRTLRDMLRTVDITLPALQATEENTTMESDYRNDEPDRPGETAEFQTGTTGDAASPGLRETSMVEEGQPAVTGEPVIEWLSQEEIQVSSTAQQVVSTTEAHPVDTAPAVSEPLQPVDSLEPARTADATSSAEAHPVDTAPAVNAPLQPVDTPEPARTADVTSSAEVQPVDTAPAVSAPLQPVDTPEPASTTDATSSAEVQPADTTPAVSAPLQPVDTPEPARTADVTPSAEVQPVETEPTAGNVSAPEKAQNAAAEGADMADAEAAPRRLQTASGDPLSGEEEATTSASSPQPDGIVYSPRRPDIAERADLDAIVRQLKWDALPDNTVTYRLDGQPAFRDLGNRLEMADGASTDDRKILAALAVAAKFYGGVIELTGSEAFRERAMNLIVDNDISVRLKLPDQRARLDALRRERGTSADAVKTHIPTPEMFTGNTAQAPQTATPAPPGSPPASAGPSPRVQAPPSPDQTDAQPAPATATEEGLSPPPRLSPGESVTAELTRYGEAEYGPGKGRSFFIELSNRDGSQVYWGRELEELVRNVHTGEAVTLTLDSRESFTLSGDDRPRFRNHWSLVPVSPGMSVSLDCSPP